MAVVSERPPLDSWKAFRAPPKGGDPARRREASDGLEEGVPDRRLVQATERRMDQELQRRGAIGRSLDQLIAGGPAAEAPRQELV